MSPKARTLLFVALASLIGGSLLLIGLTGIPQIVVGLIQGFVLPSYALGAAILPNRQLGLLRGVLAIGMNIALVILGGFVLNLLPTGLDTSAWSVFSTIVTLAAAGLAYWHERHSFPQRATPVRTPLRVGNWLVVAATLVILGISFGLSQWGAEIQPRPGFTQLWLVPVDRSHPSMMQLGVRNEENTALAYRLDLYIDGAIVRTWDSIELQRDTQWESVEDISAVVDEGSQLELLLYRMDAPTQVYRRVTWTFQDLPG